MKKYERITALLIVLAGVWIMYYAWNTLTLGSIHVPDAGFLPFLCGAGLIILSIIWLLTLPLKREPDKDGAEGKGRWLRPVLALVLMTIYGVAMEYLGYITSTLAFMVAWQKLLEREKWPKTALISILGTLAMYTLFVFFLKVPIPRELFLR